MDPVSFLIQLAVTYIINRLQQPSGPRQKDLSAGLGDYGIALPVLFGSAVRIVGVVIVQAPIKETVHKKKPVTDYIFGLVGVLLPPVKTYTYSDTIAFLLADRTNDGPIEGLVSLIAGGKTIFRATESIVLAETLDGDGNLVMRKYGKNRYCTSVTIYGGGYDQVADPVLEAATGVDDQPGYRGSAYVVIEDLQLKEFGNAVPVPIEALVQVKTGQTLADVSEIICVTAGVDADHDISSTALIANVVRGYAVTDQATCWDALKPLFPAFAFDCGEVAGQIRFYRRSQSMRATIPADDMGAHVYGDSPPERYSFQRASDLELPQETGLTFIDPDRDYQPNTATSKRSEGNAKSNVSATIPLVLTADEGATAAALMHWDAWLGRTQVKITLTDAWNGLNPGMAYAVPIGSQYVPYRVTMKTRGANGITEIEAVSDEQVTYTAQVTGASGAVEPPVSTEIPDTRLIIIDGPIVADIDDEYGFYIVTGGGDAYWNEGSIFASTDNVTYSDVMTTTESAPMGDVVGTLAAGVTDGLDDTLDTTTVLTVTLLHSGMALDDATDAELNAGANLAFVGKDGLGEYLQFKDATFVSGTTWQLTNLRRGRKGTDWAISTHASGEEFAVLSEGGRYRVAASTTDGWGVSLWLKGVTFNQDEADVTATAFTNTGEGKRPYSPINVEGTWDGSNNLTATFDSRSRLNAGGLGIDDNAEWEVQITNATPDRNITVTAETFSYTAAEQTSDGLTPGSVVIGRVRQTSDVNDGRWRDFTIYGPLGSTADSTIITADDTTLTADMG